VVLGHSISNAENLLLASRYNLEYYVSNFLYTFHMPLFFLVSGYVLFGRRIQVGDRATRLLLPFFAWIPVYWFVNRYIHHYPFPVRFGTTLKDTILNPAVGLWFLPTLFLCSMLLIPIIYLEKRRSWMGAASLVVIFVAVNLLPREVTIFHTRLNLLHCGIMQVKYFFAFFAVGYLAAKYRDKIGQLGRKRTILMLAALSVLFVGLFVLLYDYGRIKPYAFPVSLYELYKTPLAYFIRYLMAFGGIAVSIALIMSLKATRALKVFAWFGLVTMDIYVAHGLMIQLAFGSGWIKVLTGFVLGIVLSLALSLLFLRQWWVTATVFLGIKRKKPGPEVEPSSETGAGFEEGQAETSLPET
jgi:fucose 4-O-acetylase-like acetyltransferase